MSILYDVSIYGLPWCLFCNLGDLGSISGLGRYPGRGHGNPLQYSCLENPQTEEPGGLQSILPQRVGHDSATNTHTQTHINREREKTFHLIAEEYTFFSFQVYMKHFSGQIMWKPQNMPPKI